LQQAPVGLREALEEFADLEVIGGHGPDAGDQFPADVLGHSLLVHFGGQVIAPLGGIPVQGALEEVEGVVDLPFELFLAELEDFVFFAHKYAYISAYFRPSKPARQEGEIKNPTKK
jgi:hypothetical protein